MIRLWLTPITCLNPVTIGEDRIMRSPESLSRMATAAAELHPRLLPQFKTKLWIGEKGGDPSRCEPAGTALPLNDGEPIRFDGSAFLLSSCAEHFIERLLPIHKVEPLLKKLLDHADWTKEERDLLERLVLWNQIGCRIVCLKEESEE